MRRCSLLLIALASSALGATQASANPGPAPARPPAAMRAAPRPAAPRKAPVVTAPKPKVEVSPALAKARLRATKGLDVLQAVQDFPKDHDLAVAAITTNEEALKFVDKSLVRDKAFLRAAAIANPHLVMPETQDPYARAALEQVLTPKLRAELLADPDVALAVVAHKARLAKVPDVQPGLFTMNRRFQQELIDNRLAPRDRDERPVAVVAYPVEDWNGQFFERTEELVGLTKRYRVMFYQVGTDAAFVAAVADATSHKPADLVVIGGHGESALTAFGADDPAKLPERMRAQLDSPKTSPRVRQRIMDRIAKVNEERYLDLSDRAQLETVANRVAKGGSILLISCSTGKGGAEATNLANFLHGIFPQARVDAPTESVPNLGVRLDAKGYYADAGFADIGKRYRIEPR